MNLAALANSSSLSNGILSTTSVPNAMLLVNGIVEEDRFLCNDTHLVSYWVQCIVFNIYTINKYFSFAGIDKSRNKIGQCTLPAPLLPTSATVFPLPIVRLIFLKRAIVTKTYIFSVLWNDQMISTLLRPAVLLWSRVHWWALRYVRCWQALSEYYMMHLKAIWKRLNKLCEDGDICKKVSCIQSKISRKYKSAAIPQNAQHGVTPKASETGDARSRRRLALFFRVKHGFIFLFKFLPDFFSRHWTLW